MTRCRKFDVPCLKEISFALPCYEMRKNVFDHALSRHENVEKEQVEVVSKSHCGTENCKRCRVEDIITLPCVSRLDFHLQETGMIDFAQLPGPKQGIIPCSLTISCNSQCSIENIFPHLTTQQSKAKEIFFTHGTSNFQQKLEVN